MIRAIAIDALRPDIDCLAALHAYGAAEFDVVKINYDKNSFRTIIYYKVEDND